MIQFILSFLLHHANRLGKDTHFYEIKSKLLKKYGKSIGYDLQQIPGKLCYSCKGTGKEFDDTDDEEGCSCCGGSGYYKDPFYVVLTKYQLGKYQFHQPGPRIFHAKPSAELLSGASGNLTSYILHKPATAYAPVCKMLLLLLFKRRVFAYRIAPIFFTPYPDFVYSKMWHPKNLLLNLFHILYYLVKREPIPLLVHYQHQRKMQRLADAGDLPF